jgi:hypothetical protein
MSAPSPTLIRAAFVVVGFVAAGVFVYVTHWRHPGVAGLIVAVFAGAGAAIASGGWSHREEYGDHHHDE